MKKVLFLSVALCCALISFAKPGNQTRKSMLQASICQEDSSYTYEEGTLIEKMYFTYNVDGILSQILYLENEDETWAPYLLDIVYENGIEVKNIWSWKPENEWVAYEEDEYFYNESGEQTGSAIYDIFDGVKTGREYRNIVVEGNTMSNITYKWVEDHWEINYKTDVITEGNTETTISYRPGLVPMNKTVIEWLDGGKATSTDYGYDSQAEDWNPMSKTEYDNYDRPTQVIAYRYNVDTWVYTNKTVYEYVAGTNSSSNVKTYGWDAMSEDWMLNREQVYEYNGKGYNTIYISKGYMGGVLSFGNKTVNEYKEDGELLSSIMYGWDAVAADFTTPQSKNVNEFDEYGNHTFQASYSWDAELGDWSANSMSEFEYDENNNMTLERYYYYDWMTGGLYIGQENHHYYTCEATSIDQTEARLNQENTSKVIMNGALYIIKNGVMYSTQGQMIK